MYASCTRLLLVFVFIKVRFQSASNRDVYVVLVGCFFLTPSYEHVVRIVVHFQFHVNERLFGGLDDLYNG